MRRFQDAMWAENIQKLNITIIGIGGIGSYLAFFLARCGCKISLIDYDIVDETNSSGQLYGKSDVGLYKTQSLKAKLEDYCPFNENLITIYETKFTKELEPILEGANIIISAVDNIETRKEIFEIWQNNSDYFIFIDARMAAELFQCYFVDTEERANLYKETLFSTKEAEEPSCAYKATSFVGAAIGTVINQWLANKMTNLKTELDICSTPYKITYDGFNFRWDITQ